MDDQVGVVQMLENWQQNKKPKFDESLPNPERPTPYDVSIMMT